MSDDSSWDFILAAGENHVRPFLILDDEKRSLAREWREIVANMDAAKVEDSLDISFTLLPVTKGLIAVLKGGATGILDFLVSEETPSVKAFYTKLKLHYGRYMALLPEKQPQDHVKKLDPLELPPETEPAPWTESDAITMMMLFGESFIKRALLRVKHGYTPQELFDLREKLIALSTTDDVYSFLKSWIPEDRIFSRPILELIMETMREIRIEVIDQALADNPSVRRLYRSCMIHYKHGKVLITELRGKEKEASNPLMEKLTAVPPTPLPNSPE